MAKCRLLRADRFFAQLRSGLLGPRVSTAELEGCNAFSNAVGGVGWPLSWAAYPLAISYHETAHTMQPVEGTPALALARKLAAEVLDFGMGQGWFTAQDCARHLPGAGVSDDGHFFTLARGIINGRDCAPMIAGAPFAIKKRCRQDTGRAAKTGSCRLAH